MVFGLWLKTQSDHGGTRGYWDISASYWKLKMTVFGWYHLGWRGVGRVYHPFYLEIMGIWVVMSEVLANRVNLFFHLVPL